VQPRNPGFFAKIEHSDWDWVIEILCAQCAAETHF
jgi:hypothetical protein